MSIIEQTIQIIEKNTTISINGKIAAELKDLLNEYLSEDLTLSERERNASCWGGGVWDRLYHYHDRFKPLLVLNYDSDGVESPVMSTFPYEELNELCLKYLKRK